MRGIYPHGIVAGLLMTACAVWMRAWDLPVPVIAVFLVSPFFVLPGFLATRRRSLEPGLAAGMATAITGHIIVFLATMIYSAATQPWPKPLAWPVMGIVTTLLPAALGATLGALGAALARRVRSAPA